MEIKSFSHINAPTQLIPINGVTYAYRTFGLPSARPLIFLQHFTGSMDNWDPSVTDGLAKTRQVILFDNLGLGRTGGHTPDTVAQMAADALAFIKALNFDQVDLLAYSLGGFIGQLISATNPDLVRRLILVGTGPQGGTGIGDFRNFLAESKKREGAERYLFMFFEKSDFSRSKGMAVLKRLQERPQDRDTATSAETYEAQAKAIEAWGLAEDKDYSLLKKIVQPVLVVNGSNDAMFPTVNSYDLFKNLPFAQLSLYPDAAHGSLFQYAGLFVAQATDFLSDE